MFCYQWGGSVKYSAGSPTQSDIDKTETLANAFKEVFVQDGGFLQHFERKENSFQSFDWATFTPDVVNDALFKHKRKHSLSHDVKYLFIIF